MEPPSPVLAASEAPPSPPLTGPSGLMLGSMGTGTYLGDPDARTDEAVTTAVIYSVAHGWNVIDTGV